MGNMQGKLPDYSAKDIKSIRSIFLARMTKQDNEMQKNKVQNTWQKEHGGLEDGLSEADPEVDRL